MEESKNWENLFKLAEEAKEECLKDWGKNSSLKLRERKSLASWVGMEEIFKVLIEESKSIDKLEKVLDIALRGSEAEKNILKILDLKIKELIAKVKERKSTYQVIETGGG